MIKGQKRSKRPTKATKGHQRPKLQKLFISSLFNVKSSICWNEIIRRSWNFSFAIHRILEITFCQKKLRFLRISGKTTNSAYSLISIILETNEFSSVYFPKLK